MANPTADWEKVGDKFYRKIQLYTAVFDQDLELENYIVTGCSYGGAIGMLNFLPPSRFFEIFKYAVSITIVHGQEGLCLFSGAGEQQDNICLVELELQNVSLRTLLRLGSHFLQSFKLWA